MIIRTSFNDNDFINILEDYWNGFWFRNYYIPIDTINTDTDEGAREYVEKHKEAEELLEKAFYHEEQLTMEELQRFSDLIKESILCFIKLKEDYEYLKENLHINIRLSITDKDQNGEVLYYFLKHKKYIIM